MDTSAETPQGYDLSEDHIQSFLVKLWRESDGQPAQWRGQISHIPSGNRRPLHHLDDLITFMQTFVPQFTTQKVDQ